MAQGSNLVSGGHKNDRAVLIKPVLSHTAQVEDGHKQRSTSCRDIIKDNQNEEKSSKYVMHKAGFEQPTSWWEDRHLVAVL